MLTEKELNINTTERQLLYDIWQEIRRTNELLQMLVKKEPPKVKPKAAPKPKTSNVQKLKPKKHKVG